MEGFRGEGKRGAKLKKGGEKREGHFVFAGGQKVLVELAGWSRPLFGKKKKGVRGEPEPSVDG